ncbi:actin-binding WH2 domain-containing protein [Coleofasciculus sp. C1-SOL-03]|uniref:actin-binding WH2 domain-containing protein n=1 Tax=Coleofasciculus sp. C1-SOL-03 TaxID=3069522 RepID=UPI004063ED44
MNHFASLMSFLRDRKAFLSEVEKEIGLDRKIVSFLVCSASFLALYGLVVGASSHWLQAISSAIKLPGLYLITLLVCLPSLYIFEVVTGSTRNFRQYLVLLLAATSVISVMLLAFVPVVLFFLLSVNDYNFFKLLNVAIFTLTGVIGVQFFYQSMKSLHSQDAEKSRNLKVVQAWLFLYGFVGSQLGWSLRPFFGTPGKDFALFRPLESNFYVHIWKTLTHALGLN